LQNPDVVVDGRSQLVGNTAWNYGGAVWVVSLQVDSSSDM
jgi:hypothetical protein